MAPLPLVRTGPPSQGPSSSAFWRKLSDQSPEEFRVPKSKPTRELSFDRLVSAIGRVHAEMAAQAGRAVNVSLTLRNWLIGQHIGVYEQRGTDRANYGEGLLDRLSDSLQRAGVGRMEARELRRYRQFYQAYPWLRETVSPELKKLLLSAEESGSAEIRETLSPESPTPTMDLITRLSFSHFAELLKLDDVGKRQFYEMECLRGQWSVRELKRQMGSLYYERSSLSRDKEKLSVLTQQGAEYAEKALAIRDPYVFEFLGLKPAEVMAESHLEDQLLDKLQAFLLELGHGFCFERSLLASDRAIGGFKCTLEGGDRR